MRRAKKVTKLRAFDLFCGAGGSSYGARAAGMSIAGGVERAPLAAKTFRDNFPGAKVFQQDIRYLSAKAVAKEIGTIDLLLASPECTNHTIAKGKKRIIRAAQISRMTAYAVTRFAKALKPRWIAVENVVQMRQWSRFKHWQNELERLGYNVSIQVLDASKFGVRQSRRRLFVLCDRLAVPAIVKTANCRPKPVRPILNMNGAYQYSLLTKKGRAKPTLARARRGIRGAGSGRPFLMVYYGTDGSGGWQPLNVPLRTITTVDRFALVKRIQGRYRMRMLQVPELKQAMGFPLSFKMTRGNRRNKIAMLGNGVCPPVMAAIVKKLLSSPVDAGKMNDA
ncbi:MAG: DNA cytosine methyltransferase [Elusimicrobia bacterium]|nr:DNA cytosine methyltransferase [Elusimicrobiota bacterium]